MVSISRSYTHHVLLPIMYVIVKWQLAMLHVSSSMPTDELIGERTNVYFYIKR